MQYCYSEDYTTSECLSVGDGALHHAQVYGAADKYQLPELRQLATNKFEEEIDKWNKNPVIIDDMLASEDSAQSLLAAVNFVYNHTHKRNDDLRRTTNSILWTGVTLHKLGNSWTEFIKNTPAYAEDLLHASVDMLQDMEIYMKDVRTYTCWTCHRKMKMDGPMGHLGEEGGYCFWCGDHITIWHQAIDEGQPKRSEYF